MTLGDVGLHIELHTSCFVQLDLAKQMHSVGACTGELRTRYDLKCLGTGAIVVLRGLPHCVGAAGALCIQPGAGSCRRGALRALQTAQRGVQRALVSSRSSYNASAAALQA